MPSPGLGSGSDGDGSVILGLIDSAKAASTPTLLAGQLRRTILSHAPPIGTKLFTLKELSQRTGHSTGVVREAIQQLTSEGIIEVRQGNRGGIFSRKVDIDSLLVPLHGLIVSNRIVDSTVIEARQQLEGAAVRLATIRHDAASLAALRESIECMKDWTSSPTAFSLEAMRFHVLLSEASGNSVLIAINATLRELFHGEYLAHASSYDQDLVKAHRAHERIYREMENGNAEGAYEALLRHLDAFATASHRSKDE